MKARGLKFVGLGFVGLGAVVLGLGVLGCGPSYGGTGIKTPEEIVDEQERLAIEQEKEAQSYDQPIEETTPLEEKNKWDKSQVELELKRAQRSAEDCPKSIPEEERKGSPKGMASVTLTFGNDGHVKSSSVSAPFSDTALGACVLRAMTPVIVPAYEGAEETVTWEIDLTGKKKKEGAAEE